MLKIKLKYFKVLVIIFILTISFLSIIPFVFTDGESWLTGWGYRKSHTIEYASGAGTNYQVKIVVDYGSGDDSGNTVYVNGECQTDFDDIRFTDNDGDTELNYWLEDKVDSDNAIFWVEVSDDLSSVAVVFYVYYSNDVVSTTSNGVNTFGEFDDFNDGSIDGWTAGINIANWDESNGLLKMVSQDSLWRNNTQSVNLAIEVRWRLPNDYWCGGLYRSNEQKAWWQSATVDQWVDMIIHEADEDRLRRCDNGVLTTLDNWARVDYTVFSRWSMVVYGSSHKAFKDGVEILSATDTSYQVEGYVGICGRESSGLEVDWFAVRKYVSPEPVHGAWGEEETEGEDSFPFYSSVGSNGVTQVGENADFWVFWEDDFNLETCKFETNNTGVAVNHTLSVSGVSSWANKTLQLNYTSSVRVNYQWFCSDNASQWNATSIYFLTTTPLYITFNFNNSTMGKFKVNGVNTANETQNSYNFNQSILLDGIPLSSDYIWNNFTWIDDNSLINNYDYDTSGNNTIWCYFGLSGVSGINESYFVLGFVIAGCAILFIIIVFKSDKKEK